MFLREQIGMGHLVLWPSAAVGPYFDFSNAAFPGGPAGRGARKNRKQKNKNKNDLVVTYDLVIAQTLASMLCPTNKFYL